MGNFAALSARALVAVIAGSPGSSDSGSLPRTGSDSTGLLAGAGGLVMLLIYLGLVLIYVAGMWQVFQKAGQKGWFAIIPILNLYVLIKIAGRESWWLILALIPCVNFVVLAIVSIDVAKAFGKSEGYGIGLWLLGIIFYPLLGFGDARYNGAQQGPVL